MAFFFIKEMMIWIIALCSGFKIKRILFNYSNHMLYFIYKICHHESMQFSLYASGAIYTGSLY